MTQRRQQEDDLVGAGRDDRFLEHEFEKVGEGLQQAVGAHDVGPAPHLHRRPDLAVGKSMKAIMMSSATSSTRLCTTMSANGQTVARPEAQPCGAGRSRLRAAHASALTRP